MTSNRRKRKKGRENKEKQKRKKTTNTGPSPTGDGTINEEEHTNGNSTSDDRSSMSSRASSSSRTSDQPKYRPVPIVIHTEGYSNGETMGVINFTKDDSETTQYKIAKKTLTLYTQSKADHASTTKGLQQRRMKFHTFTQKHEKDFKFVIKGLPAFNPQDVLMELEEMEFAPKRVTQMKSSKEAANHYPFYFVSMGPETDVSSVYQIKAIGKIRVRIERYRNTRSITQCYNCQQFGHGSSNCYRRLKCVKCTGDHKTKDCPKTKDDKPKCTNCGKDHPANFSGCEAYISYS